MSITKAFKGFCIVIVLGLVQLAMAQDTSELINLSLDDLLNMEVTTASKSAEKLSDAAGVITVVTQDEIQRFGGTTLKDVLARVPSLSSTLAFFTDRSIVASRGSQIKINSGHVLLLINGRPLREVVEGGIGSEMYETFPVNVIERIEVIKGPGSVLYGTNAFSAVINVITKTAEKNGASVTALTGVDGAYGTSGTVTLKKGDFSMIAAGRYYELAEWEMKYKVFSWFTNTLENYDITTPSKGPGAYIGINYKNLRIMSSYNQWQGMYVTNGFYGINKWTKNFNDIGYNHVVNDKWNMDFNLTYTHATMEPDSWPNNKRYSNDLVAEWTNYVSVSDKARLIVGGLLNYVKGKETTSYLGPSIVISDDNRKTYSFFTQMDYQAIDNLKLIGGFQANKAENLDLDLVPRAGAIWYPHERVNVKALYSQAFRAPSINEVGLTLDGLMGNPDLEPEKVSTTDLGINYLGDRFQLGFNVFNSDLSGIIVPGVVDSVNMYVNASKINVQGVEFEGKYYVTDAIYLTGSFLYQNNENSDTNEKDVTPLPNFGAKGGISYMSENGITVSLFNIYEGKLDDKYVPTLNPNTGAYNMASLHCNLNVNKFFKLNIPYNYSVFMQVDNLLDKELWLPDWGGVPGETSPANSGRAIYVGLNAAL